MPVVADEQVTVCCGATEAMMATMMAIIDPGDEVVIFEPFYENYGPDAILSGATPRYVTLHEPDWTLRSRRARGGVQREDESDHHQHAEQPDRQGVHARGARDDRRALPQVGRDRDLRRDLRAHHLRRPPAHSDRDASKGMADRTVTINGLSKTYSVTGWRVGWTISPPSLTGAIRKVHDFLTVGAAAPLQEAGAVALGSAGASTTSSSRPRYQRRRDVLLEILERHHFTCYKPYGAYYIMTDISAFGFADDVEFARYLVKDVGVAAVPGSSFYKTRRGPHEAAVLFLQEGRDAAGSRPAPGEAGASRRPLRPGLHKRTRRTRRNSGLGSSENVFAFQCPSLLVSAQRSVPQHRPEIQPLQRERSRIRRLERVSEIQRTVSGFDADVSLKFRVP